jgi:NADH-quinone oxidoreductase subunit H
VREVDEIVRSATLAETGGVYWSGDVILIAKVVLALIIMNMMLGLISYAILLERKTAAWIQDRVGPNRVGPKGLFQPLADGVKFILKEEFIPKNADKALFLIAPVAILTPALCGFSVIPFGGVLKAGSTVFGWWTFPQDFPFMVSNPSAGVLIAVAAAGLATYGVVLGGWASGSKFSFFGALRAAAQMLSYEVPMALSLMAVLVVMGTLNLEEVVMGQAGYWLGFIPKWNVFEHPVPAVIFTIAIFAEANRTPFDLPECESELVGGYHTEYSSMKFALFFLAEYAAMITGSAVMVAVFLGGWHLPWIDLAIYHGPQGLHEVTGWLGVLLKFVVFWGKVVLFLFFYMWVRWTLPRFRFDQLMGLAWRGLIPMSLAAFLITTVVVFLQRQTGLRYGPLWIFLANIVVFAVTLAILSRRPPRGGNKRIPVAGSRYNPQFAKQLAGMAAQ